MRHYVIAGIVFLAVGCAAQSPSPTQKAEPVEVTPEMRAFAETRYRQAVLQELKAPATAQFPGQPHVFAGDIGKTRALMASGDVDSQNGFGALVRSRYMVSWRWDGTTWVPDGTFVSTRN